jgi:hypothetical protein
VLLSDKRWLKVRLFGNFVKSAQYKKHIGRLLLQLLKPKQLLTQPWLNGGQKSDFRQFHNSRSRQGTSGSPFIPIAQISVTFGSTLDKRRSKVKFSAIS